MLEIHNVGAEMLTLYTTIPIAFEVRTMLRPELIEGGLGGIRLHEEWVLPPYVKNYDEHAAERPDTWPERFDIRNWGLFLAWQGETAVGAAAIAFNTSDVNMLDGRDDLAVLWDLRVHPRWRRQGVGAKLFGHSAEWSRARGCRQLKIETQNINVPACCFYAGQGCTLGDIRCYGYAGQPAVAHEIMLIWYLDL